MVTFLVIQQFGSHYQRLFDNILILSTGKNQDISLGKIQDISRHFPRIGDDSPTQQLSTTRGIQMITSNLYKNILHPQNGETDAYPLQ